MMQKSECSVISNTKTIKEIRKRNNSSVNDEEIKQFRTSPPAKKTPWRNRRSCRPPPSRRRSAIRFSPSKRRTAFSTQMRPEMQGKEG